MTTLPLALPAAATPPVASGTGSKTSGNSSSGFDAMLADAMPGQDVPATPQGEVPVSFLLQTELLGAGEAAADGEVAAEVPEGATEESTAGVAGRTDAVDAGALFLTPAPFSLAEAVRLTAAAQDGAVVTTGTPSDQTSGPTTGPTTGSTPSTGTGQISGQSIGQIDGAMAGEGVADALAPLAGPTTDRTDDGAAQETGFAARGSGAPGTSGDAVPAPGAGSTTPGAPAPAPAPAPTSVSAGTVDVSALTPVSAASAASSPSVNGAAAPATAPASPAQQVMPEVSRLVQRGDGTHRLTLTLTPEALGDVRVTLTVRQGEVSVSFAAGDEARRALIESTPELRRLLELGGATTSRVTVSDLTGGRPGDGTGQRPDDGSGSWLDQSREGGRTGADSGGQPRGSDRTPQDLHAGTRAGTTATDGNHRGPGDAGRPLDPGTSTRPAGLDVTV